jgi:hypothetical protein
MEANLNYYRRRASEERTAALQSRHPRVRRVHLEMAQEYEERVRGIAAGENQPAMRLVAAEGGAPSALVAEAGK